MCVDITALDILGLTEVRFYYDSIYHVFGDVTVNFNFGFGRTPNTGKVIQGYLKVRLEEKRTLRDQLERLDAQLKDNTLDQETYERLKDVLEINFLKQREERLAKTFKS